MLKIDEKENHFRVLRSIPGWLWRLICSALLGWLAIATIVPWAQTQRGSPAIGGEYLLTFAAVILPFCIFRR